MGNNQSKLYKTPKYDDFHRIRELSRGAFGRVLVVRYKDQPDVELIMKRLPYLDVNDKQAADEEIAMLQKLQVKYCVCYYGSFVYDDDICIIMEYCVRGNLRDLIESMKGWSLKDRKKRSFKVIFHTLTGLAYLHQQGIVHCDLKPENIYIDKDGTTKMGDFGLGVKMLSKSYIKAAGMKDYTPPEAFENNRMTFQSNIWSLGVILVELLTGKHPYEGKTQDETMKNISSGRMAPLPADIKGEIKEMIVNMLKKNPSNRPTAQQLLEKDLMQMQSEIENEQEKVKEIEVKTKQIEMKKEVEQDPRCYVSSKPGATQHDVKLDRMVRFVHELATIAQNDIVAHSVKMDLVTANGVPSQSLNVIKATKQEITTAGKKAGFDFDANDLVIGIRAYHTVMVTNDQLQNKLPIMPIYAKKSADSKVANLVVQNDDDDLRSLSVFSVHNSITCAVDKNTVSNFVDFASLRGYDAQSLNVLHLRVVRMKQDNAEAICVCQLVEKNSRAEMRSQSAPKNRRLDQGWCDAPLLAFHDLVYWGRAAQSQDQIRQIPEQQTQDQNAYYPVASEPSTSSKGPIDTPEEPEQTKAFNTNPANRKDSSNMSVRKAHVFGNTRPITSPILRRPKVAAAGQSKRLPIFGGPKVATSTAMPKILPIFGGPKVATSTAMPKILPIFGGPKVATSTAMPKIPNFRRSNDTIASPQ
ncbi:MAG: putative serine/threonine-protein kinase Nek3, partial [Streblomastix strix]